MFVFEFDELGGGVGTIAGLVLGWGGGGDGEDSAAVGVEVALGDFGSGVVDLDALECLGFFDSGDDIADAWVLWVAV